MRHKIIVVLAAVAVCLVVPFKFAIPTDTTITRIELEPQTAYAYEGEEEPVPNAALPSEEGVQSEEDPEPAAGGSGAEDPEPEPAGEAEPSSRAKGRSDHSEERDSRPEESVEPSPSETNSDPVSILETHPVPSAPAVQQTPSTEPSQSPSQGYQTAPVQPSPPAQSTAPVQSSKPVQSTPPVQSESPVQPSQQVQTAVCSRCGGALNTQACMENTMARGAVGRWVISGVGVDVALFQSNSQTTVDRADSAAYFYYGSALIIADHCYQGFDRIESCYKGMTAYVETASGVQQYVCVDAFQGSNTGAELLDPQGRNVAQYNGGNIICYTCLSTGWQNVMIVVFAPVG